MDGNETRFLPENERKPIKLTQRELGVLYLVVEGKSSQEVAEALSISVNTVKRHLAKIYRKLDVKNRVQAFREATRRGLINL